MYCAWISDSSKMSISRVLADAESSEDRMTWMTSSMFSRATKRPSTRWSRSDRLRRRYSVRRRITSSRCATKISSSSRSPSTRGWPSTRATLLMPNVSSIGVSRYSSASTASGLNPLRISITRCRPRFRSVRSFRSAMPFSFLAWTRSLILVMTFSGPTL